MVVNQRGGSSGTKRSSRGRSSGHARTADRSFTDHQKIEWQFDVAEVEPVEAEFVPEVYGEPVQKFIKPLKALQDDLGDHQDAIIVAEHLRELGTTTGGPQVPRGAIFTMGVYSERRTREAIDLRPVVLESKALRALIKGKSWKDIEKIMEDTRKSQDEAGAAGKVVR